VLGTQRPSRRKVLNQEKVPRNGTVRQRLRNRDGNNFQVLVFTGEQKNNRWRKGNNKVNSIKNEMS
jgi:hypothetical protein